MKAISAEEWMQKQDEIRLAEQEIATIRARLASHTTPAERVEVLRTVVADMESLVQENPGLLKTRLRRLIRKITVKDREVVEILFC